jgi:hypothetical protein
MKRQGTVTPLGLMISSNDPNYPTECKITEERYQVEKEYKISLTPVEYQGYVEHYYVDDLASLIDGGIIKIK